MANAEEIKGWVVGRIPADWFDGTPEVLVDREEIVVTGKLPDVGASEGMDASAARSGRIKQHREATRDARVRIAREAQSRFGRTVSWGAACGDTRELFTHLSVPMMTRLRITDRQILDALVDAGVARSRSHALAWCVRLVAKHQGDWVRELKDAVAKVEQVRATGPEV